MAARTELIRNGVVSVGEQINNTVLGSLQSLLALSKKARIGKNHLIWGSIIAAEATASLAAYLFDPAIKTPLDALKIPGAFGAIDVLVPFGIKYIGNKHRQDAEKRAQRWQALMGEDKHYLNDS